MAILGHSTMAMTMRYSHLADKHKKDAMNKLGDFIGKARGPKTYIVLKKAG